MSILTRVLSTIEMIERSGDREIYMTFTREELLSLRDSIVAPPHLEIRKHVETVLKGFDEQVFIRNTDGDHFSGWAVKCLPYITALTQLVKAVKS